MAKMNSVSSYKTLGYQKATKTLNFDTMFAFALQGSSELGCLFGGSYEGSLQDIRKLPLVLWGFSAYPDIYHFITSIWSME